MVSVTTSREDRRVTTAFRKRTQAPIKDVGLERGEPSSVSLDLTDDDVSLAGASAEDPAEPLHLVEQSRDFVWDEEESGALRDARKGRRNHTLRRLNAGISEADRQHRPAQRRGCCGYHVL